MRVLIAAEDYELGLPLVQLLVSSGHEVEWAYAPEHALDHVHRSEPDLVVLDLSGGIGSAPHGLDILRYRPSRTSVLILNEDFKSDERIQCFHMGADDCVAKPFLLEELAARCEAVLRRKAGRDNHVKQFGALQLDRLRRQVTLNGNAVKLTTKEFLLLDLLVQGNGKCFRQEEIRSRIWQGSSSQSNLVEFYINRLRNKLSVGYPAFLDASSCIQTVRGKGYRIRGHQPSPEPHPMRISPGLDSHVQQLSAL